MKISMYLLAAAAMAVVLITSGCKKNSDGPNEEIIIKLQPGLTHISSQWIDDKLWVESFDPKTNACLLRAYGMDGAIVEGAVKIRLRGCRVGVQEEKAPVGPPLADKTKQPPKQPAKTKPVVQK